MNQQSTGPAREFRAVEKLTGGEHVNHQAHQFADVMTWQVGHVAPYSDDNSVPMVALTLTPVGGGSPELIRERRGVTLPLATDAEIADAAAAVRRFALAQALRVLADDIVDRNLPMPDYHLNFSAGVLRSRAELDRWAAYLGVEVLGGTPGDPIPAVDGERPIVGQMVLGIHAQCPAEPEAREIKARYLTPGMTVVDDVRERNLTVTVVNPGAGDTVLVSFEGVPTWKPYGVEEAVTVLTDATPTHQAGA